MSLLASDRRSCDFPPSAHVVETVNVLAPICAPMDVLRRGRAHRWHIAEAAESDCAIDQQRPGLKSVVQHVLL